MRVPARARSYPTVNRRAGSCHTPRGRWRAFLVPRPLTLALAAALGLALASRPAAASPEAERLFREGRALIRAGRVAEACDRFERSQKLEPTVGTLLNLADCRERLGHTATAWSTFVAAEDEARRAGDTRRASEAKRRAASLAPKLPHLTTQILPAARVDGLVVRRNGVELPETAWDQAEAVDPGAYVIEAAAPGRRPFSTSVTLAAGERRAVTVEALARDERVVPAPPSDAATTSPAPPAVLPLLPARNFGVGVFLGATQRESAVFGVRALGTMELPSGLLRGAASALVTRYEDEPGTDTMPAKLTNQLTLGLGVDYVWLPVPQVGLGAGLGVGADFDFPDSNRPSDVGGWWAVRGSPVIVRLARGALELGLHVQVVRAGSEWTTYVVAAGDVYF